MKKILVLFTTVALIGFASMSLAQGEKHPQMHKAIEKLREAKKHMENAAHDFHGHRAKALELTEQAIHELEEGLKSDRK